MASNIVITFPPAPGAALPPVELKAFGNNSGSTQDLNLNYVSGTPAVTTPVDGNIHTRAQYIRGQQEYPR